MDSVSAESVIVTADSRGTAVGVAPTKAPACTMIWSVMELEFVNVESANVQILNILEAIVRSVRVVTRRNVGHTKAVRCVIGSHPGY